VIETSVPPVLGMRTSFLDCVAKPVSSSMPPARGQALEDASATTTTDRHFRNLRTFAS
jgi:hypothetical protein